MSPSTSRREVAKPARFTVLTAILCGALSCSDPGTTGGTGGNGSGGTTGTGGVTSTGGSTGTGGTTSTGGTTGTGGTISTGGNGATTGTGGKGTGGETAAGGTTGTGGVGGKPGTGGTGTGGTSTGGTTGTGGVGGKPGTGGTGTGGTSTGGTTGTGGTTSTGGSSGNANPSGLPLPPGAGGMAKPSGTPSTITVLSWAGFKGAVSYTLDDDNSSQISNYSMLQAQGIPYTFYMWGNRTEASNAVWAQAVKDGSEIGNHTWSHSSSGTTSDINQDTTFIMQHLSVTPYTMAAPNGASVYTQLANGLFMINRGVSDAIIKPNDNTDRFTLPCYIPATGAPASAFNSEVDSAQSAGGWRVILVHGFTGGTDSAYQPVGISDYIAGIQHTKSLGNMWIGTVETVGAYWLGQKAFGSATTTTSGSNKTWTWTKPSNFPPGKYLRVTVAGGTLTQGGQALPWNDHGYYEIALDAGSVTLGP
jgi:hypothetical protein